VGAVLAVADDIDKLSHDLNQSVIYK